MSSVQISVSTPSKSGIVSTIDGDLIKKHSATVREIIDAQQPSLVYNVTLTNVAPAAIGWIIKQVDGHARKKTLYLRVSDLPLLQAVCIEEAVRVLRIEPDQPHIAGHILGYVSHNIVTPSEMVTIHKAYGNLSDSRIHKALIHDLSYNMVGGLIDAAKMDELWNAAKPYPALITAVEDRIKGLKLRQAQTERYKRLKALEPKPLKGKALEKWKLDEAWKANEIVQRDWKDPDESQEDREISEEDAKKIMGRC